MTQRTDDLTPILRVELKRADAGEWLRADRELSACPLVKALGARAADVLSTGVVRRYPDKVVVYQQNDQGGSLFLVLAGEARLFARKQADTVELGLARKGDVLGESEVLAGSASRQASVIAHGQLDLVEVSQAALTAGKALPPAVRAALEAVRAGRTAKLDEMTDFLNRW